MNAQELVEGFYLAIGQSGRSIDDTDLATARKLIERHGHMTVEKLLPMAVKLVAAAPSPVPDFADSVPYFAQAAVKLVEATPAKERDECDRQQRLEQDHQARAEAEQVEAAFQKLPRSRQRELYEAELASRPPGPAYFIKRLAAKEASR